MKVRSVDAEALTKFQIQKLNFFEEGLDKMNTFGQLIKIDTKRNSNVKGKIEFNLVKKNIEILTFSTLFTVKLLNFFQQFVVRIDCKLFCIKKLIAIGS